MTQTENLKLNLWAPSDAVNLGQMNDNFQKIDGGGTCVKLMEVNDTVGGANQINLNFAGIHLQDYAYLDIVGTFAMHSTINPAYTAELYMRFNNLSDAFYMQSEQGVKYKLSNGIHLGKASTNAVYPQAHSVAKIRLFLLDHCLFVRSENYMQHWNTPDARYEIFYVYTLGSYMKELSVDTLQSLNFYTTTADALTHAGTKLTIFGVKK